MVKRLIPPNPIERYFNKTIFVSKYVYLDRWSFVHLGSGLGLGYLMNRYFSFLQYPYWWALFILIAYEIFEVFFWGILFRKESKLNIYWDITVGMIGFWVYWFLIR